MCALLRVMRLLFSHRRCVCPAEGLEALKAVVWLGLCRRGWNSVRCMTRSLLLALLF